MMSYLCGGGAEGVRGGGGYVARGDAGYRGGSVGQWTVPTQLALRGLWGSRLSILCLLGDQWRALILPNSPYTDLRSGPLTMAPQ